MTGRGNRRAPFGHAKNYALIMPIHTIGDSQARSPSTAGRSNARGIQDRTPGPTHLMTSPFKLDRQNARHFRVRVLDWAKEHGRAFFWRKHGVSPFAVLVTEILLARTRAEAVEPVAKRLLQRYPNAKALREAPVRSVQRMVYPLGLYRKRAKALVKLAVTIAAKYRGSVPRQVEELVSLPYVGRYAANALLCFSLGERRPVVDANVARLFQRFFGLQPAIGKLDGIEDYWNLSSRLLPRRNVRFFNWALLDLGALVCTPRKPLCRECPLVTDCQAHRRSTCGCSERSALPK